MDYTISIYKDMTQKPVAREKLDFDFFWNEKRRNEFYDNLSTTLGTGEQITVTLTHKEEQDISAHQPMIAETMIVDVDVAEPIIIAATALKDERLNNVIEVTKKLKPYMHTAHDVAHEAKMIELQRSYGCTPTY